MTLHKFLGKVALFILAAGIATAESQSIRAKSSDETKPSGASHRRGAGTPDARHTKAHHGKISSAPNATAKSNHAAPLHHQPLSRSPKSLTNKPLSHDDYYPTTPPSCSEATLYFKTDSYPYDTFVTLTDLNTGALIWSQGGDSSETEYSITSGCLDPYGCYLFHFIDTAGDALCCEYGQGYFELYYNNALTLYGDTIYTFGQSAITYLGEGCYFV